MILAFFIAAVCGIGAFVVLCISLTYDVTRADNPAPIGWMAGLAGLAFVFAAIGSMGL